MSVFISAAFIDTWNAEAKLVYQQTTSRLREGCRTVSNVIGKTYRFQLVGAGTASSKARHADLQPMNLADTVAIATIAPFFAMELIDIVDELQTNMDIRSAYTQSVVSALSRQLDSLIITALSATTNDGTSNLVNANTLDSGGLIALSKLLTLNNVPDQDRYAAVSPGGMSNILNDTKIVNELYVDRKALISGYAEGVVGFNTIRTSLLSGVAASGGTAVNLFWHKMAVGLAIELDVTLEVDWIPLKQSWAVIGKMSAGSILIDPLGAYKASINN